MTTLSYSIPVAGIDLNSTTDPQISTALTAIRNWSTSIDTSNLSATTAIAGSQLAGGYGTGRSRRVSTNTSAADRKFYVVSAAATMTLPAPTVNATIGVMNQVVGGSVTITASSGSIFGLGLSLLGVSSFTMGQRYSQVILLGQGTYW